MHYRRDIDGLRAVAVGSVVLFHAGLSPFGGGYVGVDVFFVISGYLITSIIAEDVRRGRFSIVSFYERRVRRIFPVLFVMLLVTAAAASILLLPRDFKEFGQSAISSTLFVSNIFFWRTSDYFAGAAHLKPLLHTWSLSVEEQFYIFFPPLLLMLHRRFGGRFVPWLALIAALTFALSAVGAVSKPTATFFLAPTRTWELLAGSLVALGAFPVVHDRRLREALAAIGIGLISWSVATFNEQTVFPGVSALAPCLGAGLVIHAGLGGPTFVGRGLGLRPVVFLGLISYSLYLWHWPFLALSRHWAAEPLSPVMIASALVGALIASVLSWRFVEQPFRHRVVTPTRQALFGAAGVAMTAALMFGAFGHFTGGWPARFPDYRPAEIAGRQMLREGSCFLRADQSPSDYAGAAPCRAGPAEGGRHVLVWGDSFAAHLMPGLGSPDTGGLSFYQYTASGCPPILGRSIANRPLCRLFNERALDQIREIKPQVVVLAARWEFYLGRSPDIAAIAATVGRIKALGAEVVLVGQGPSFDFDSPYDFGFRTSRTIARAHPADHLNVALARAGAAAFIDPMAVFCSGGGCELKDGESFLFFDGGHFSLAGSKRFRRHLLPLIENPKVQ